MTTIGQRILHLRKQQKMTQEELAFKIGTSQRQVSFYETGKNEPTANVLNLLADALNTTSDYLIGRTGIPDRALRGSGDLDELELEAIRVIRSLASGERTKAIKVLQALVSEAS